VPLLLPRSPCGEIRSGCEWKAELGPIQELQPLSGTGWLRVSAFSDRR
jgi:hypothetical protein